MSQYVEVCLSLICGESLWAEGVVQIGMGIKFTSCGVCYGCWGVTLCASVIWGGVTLGGDKIPSPYLQGAAHHPSDKDPMLALEDHAEHDLTPHEYSLPPPPETSLHFELELPELQVNIVLDPRGHVEDAANSTYLMLGVENLYVYFVASDMKRKLGIVEEQEQSDDAAGNVIVGGGGGGLLPGGGAPAGALTLPLPAHGAPDEGGHKPFLPPVGGQTLEHTSQGIVRLGCLYLAQRPFGEPSFELWDGANALLNPRTGSLTMEGLDISRSLYQRLILHLGQVPAVCWDGNRLVYPHRTGFRPVSCRRVMSRRMHSSPCHRVMSDAQSCRICGVSCRNGCTVSFRMHSLDRIS